jgi:hypothetical protein
MQGQEMKNLVRCLLAALAGVVIGSPARADSLSPPLSYKQVTAGGEYVFVMIAPMSVEEEAERWNEKTAAGIREIRRIYSRSGLYRKDSAEPLWTVAWYAHEVEVAPDGVHLIRHGPLPSLSPQSRPLLGHEALTFFASGRLVRTYRIAELVDSPDRLPRTVAHFTWMKDGQLAPTRSEYTLTTPDGNVFVFDIRTGEILSRSRVADRTEEVVSEPEPARPVRWVWMVAFGVLAGIAAAWLARRWRGP